MITEAQRQEYIARGYDIIFERNDRAFVVNSNGVNPWDDEKKAQNEEKERASPQELGTESDEENAADEEPAENEDAPILIVTADRLSEHYIRKFPQYFYNPHIEIMGCRFFCLKTFSTYFTTS